MRTIPSETDVAAQAAAADRPLRLCVVCRASHPRAGLIRLVRRPSGQVGLWSGASAARGPRAPRGKGLYVCLEGGCLERLLSEKRFKRMFVDTMEEECVARLREMLASRSPLHGKPGPDQY